MLEIFMLPNYPDMKSMEDIKSLRDTFKNKSQLGFTNYNWHSKTSTNDKKWKSIGVLGRKEQLTCRLHDCQVAGIPRLLCILK